MSIDPEKFSRQGRPTTEQMKAIWLEHGECSGGKLAQILGGRGFKTSKATCCRAIARGFSHREAYETAKVKRAADRASMKPLGEVVADVVAQTEAMLGKKMGPEEIDRLQARREELLKMELPELKALQEKNRLIYNNMVLEEGQRIADKHVLIPKDTAGFVVAMTDAKESLSEVPSGILTMVPKQGNGAMIDVTPNPVNPVASAIDSFQRKRLAG